MHMVTDEGEEHNYAIKLTFKTTNNEVEYEGLFLDLTIAKSLHIEEVEVQVDSHVVVSQVQGGICCKEREVEKVLNINRGQAYLLQIILDLVSSECQKPQGK